MCCWVALTTPPTHVAPSWLSRCRTVQWPKCVQEGMLWFSTAYIVVSSQIFLEYINGETLIFFFHQCLFSKRWQHRRAWWHWELLCLLIVEEINFLSLVKKFYLPPHVTVGIDINWWNTSFWPKCVYIGHILNSLGHYLKDHYVNGFSMFWVWSLIFLPLIVFVWGFCYKWN